MILMLEDDLVTGIASGDMAGIPCPPDLAGLPLARLRVVDGAVIDAAQLTMIHVDAHGRRHAVAGPGRTPLPCGIDDPIHRTQDDGWAVGVGPAALLAHAAARRWALETGGMLWQGHRIATDRETQAKLTAMYTLARDVPTLVIPSWVLPSGEIISLSNTDIQAMAPAVFAHVQQAFGRYAEVAAAVAAGEIATLDEVDAAFDAPINGP